MRKIVFGLLSATAIFSQESLQSNSGDKEMNVQADIFFSRNSISVKDSGEKIPKSPPSGTNVLDKIWELEADLYFNFRFKRTYGGVRLRFDNNMGALGGTNNDIELLRAFMGYNFIYRGLPMVNLEVGRVVRSDYFDSRVMFSNTNCFDGAYFLFHHHFPKVMVLDITLAGIVIDWLTNHYGWVGQISMAYNQDKGPLFEYCYIDWEKSGRTRIFNGGPLPVGFTTNNPQFQFRISQVLLEYAWRKIPFANMPVKAYGAFLINHAARRTLPDGTTLTGFRKENKAWYVGATLGAATAPRKFALDVNYQWVQAQAIPDFDMQGIGTGNPRSNVFYGPAVDDFTGLPVVVTQANANGNTNYKGWQFIFIYCITDNLFLETIYMFSHRENKNIGPDRSFDQFTAFLRFHW